ncbi:MAG TPA: cyclic nucleotide-binding domain-containing protein [Opitutaceae bacterium]|nr:cyclic nucleotide-binding domain-containing protein [Opitutaceae bacterium]
MNESLLLTAEKLSLNRDLRFGRSCKGAFVVKNVPAQTYLTVTPRQWAVIQEFNEPVSVPDVLGKMIQERTCPALNEFYEVVLKAHRAGILHEGQNVPFRRNAVRWFVPLPTHLTLTFAIAIMVAAIGLIFFRQIPGYNAAHWQLTWQDFVAGWLAVSAGLSAGYAVTASVLRSSGNEVYRPRLHWQTLVPHFALDVRDICMADPATQMAAWCGFLAPLGAIAGLALFLQKPWALFPLLGFFIGLRPVDGLFGQMSALLRRRPRLDVDHHLLFSLNHEPMRRLQIIWRQFDWRATAMELVLGVGWALLGAGFVFNFLNLSFRATLSDAAYWRRSIPYLAGAVILVAAAWCVYQFWQTMRLTVRNFVRRWQRRWQRWHASAEPTYTEGNLRQAITRSTLLRRLDVDTQTELSTLLRPLTVKAWRTVISFDEPSDQIGLIASGSAAVYRRLKSGRRAFAFQLSEGDVFGTREIVDPHNPQLEVRSRTPLFAYALPAAEFERLVGTKLGAETVYNLTHKLAFLRRLPICSHWGSQATARFAQLSQIVKYPEGEMIMHEGDNVQAFYIIYDGSVQAMRGSKRVGRIRRGGFFGEISLLQNGVATASLIAREETLCLALSRADFLRFVRHNYYVAMELERVSSRRLGRPVFPLNPLSIGDYYASYSPSEPNQAV